MTYQQTSEQQRDLNIEANQPSRVRFIFFHLFAVLCGGLPSFIAFSSWTYPIPLIIVFLPTFMLFQASMRAQSVRIETCFLSIAISFFPGVALSGVLWFIYYMGSGDWR